MDMNIYMCKRIFNIFSPQCDLQRANDHPSISILDHTYDSQTLRVRPSSNVIYLLPFNCGSPALVLQVAGEAQREEDSNSKGRTTRTVASTTKAIMFLRTFLYSLIPISAAVNSTTTGL
jgi:hypothetical protein